MTTTLQKLFLAANDFPVNTIYWRKERLDHEDNFIRNYPAPWIKKTIEFLEIIGAKKMVEIGATRFGITQPCISYYEVSYTAPSCKAPPDCQDGHSTYFWAQTGMEVHTVDIDARCKEVIEGMYEHHLHVPFPENLTLHIPSDGIEFLKGLDVNSLDFLYLDGWDRGTEQFAEKHLEAFYAAQPALKSQHIISIDDTDFDTELGGKDRLVTPVLIELGYIPLLRGRQNVFYKGA